MWNVKTPLGSSFSSIMISTISILGLRTRGCSAGKSGFTKFTAVMVTTSPSSSSAASSWEVGRGDDAQLGWCQVCGPGWPCHRLCSSWSCRYLPPAPTDIFKQYSICIVNLILFSKQLTCYTGLVSLSHRHDFLPYFNTSSTFSGCPQHLGYLQD